LIKKQSNDYIHLIEIDGKSIKIKCKNKWLKLNFILKLEQK